MMLPTCTSGSVNVLARYLTPLAFAMVLSNALPSKLTILPSGRIVRADHALLAIKRNFHVRALPTFLREYLDTDVVTLVSRRGAVVAVHLALPARWSSSVLRGKWVASRHR